jgi:hypothetical protein
MEEKVMNKKLCSDLKKALNTPPVCSDNHIDETIKMVQKEYIKHKKIERIGYFEFLLRQIPFVGRKIWMMQGGILIFMCWLLNVMFTGNLRYIGNRHIADILCFFAVFTTLMSMPFFQRSRKYKMYEVEAATRMSIPKLIFSNVLIIAIGNVVVFTAVTLVAVYEINILPIFIVLYLLLPFLISWCGCIFILNRNLNHKEYSYFICEVFCLFLLLLQTAIHALVPQIYSEANLIGWLIITLIFAVTLVVQLKQLMKKFALMYYPPVVS